MNIQEIVGQMTLEEKAALLTGEGTWYVKNAPRLGFEKMMMSDGPHGLRKQEAQGDNLGIYDSIVSVCFPSASLMACSFDRKAFAKLGETLGNECAAENVAVLLGPGINMKRSPLCGRNFEYLSEDPFLAGELAAEYVNGVQRKGVGTSVKHFAANNQEYKRMLISSVVDERTLREIYLYAFEIVVKKANPWTIMASYNKINGTYATENEWLLNHVLRDEWGYDGFVVTDWGASNDRVAGLKAGNDLEMPTSMDHNTKKILAAVSSGELDEAVIDRAVARILNIALRHQEQVVKDAVYDRDADHSVARELAESSMVLLKNEADILPLTPSAKIAFIGEFAAKPRYQGGGSSHINAYQVVSAVEAAKETGLNVTYAQGYRIGDTVPDRELTAQAVQAAKGADAAVVFVGLTDLEESEGYDRKTLDLPAVHNAIVTAVAAVQPNTVVVLHAGAPVLMPWLSRVKGVLCAYLGGEACGEAVVNLLLGNRCPSGKLAETYPLALSDTPAANYFPGNTRTVEYREGPYIGYRYYDKVQKDVLFEFGYGLSYTTFEYANLTVSSKELKSGQPLTVELNVKNTGKRDSAEVVQIYVQPPEEGVFHPVRTLCGFEKVWIRAGETAHVSIELPPRSFEYYHVGEHRWCAQPGIYTIHAAASSRDLRLRTAVSLTGEGAQSPYEAAWMPAYFSGKITDVPDGEFEALLGHAVPDGELPADYRFTVNDCLYDARHTKWGRRLMKVAKKICGEKYAVLLEAVVTAPVRAIVSMAPGKIGPEDAQAIADLMNNDHAMRALRRLLRTVKGIAKK